MLPLYRCTPHWYELRQLSVNLSFIIITHCFSSMCAISSSTAANESSSLWTIKKQVTKQEWKNARRLPWYHHWITLRSIGFRRLLSWTFNMANCNGVATTVLVFWIRLWFDAFPLACKPDVESPLPQLPLGGASDSGQSPQPNASSGAHGGWPNDATLIIRTC